MSIEPSNTERLALRFIKLSRKYFRNTWVHRLPFTSWTYKKIFRTINHGAPEKEVIFRGMKLLVYTKDTSLVPSIINQDYEFLELNIFEQLLKPGMTVLDIGANIGIYSILASDKVGKKGNVFAFEPVPENLSLIRHNLTLNHIKNVKVVPSAVGDKKDRVTISLVENSLGTHSVGAESAQTLEVNQIKIDDFVSLNKIKVDIIKIDIEGYEAHALDGAKHTIQDKNIILLMEFSAKLLKNCGTDPQKFAKYLLSNFKYCYDISERKGSLRRISGSRELTSLENNNLLLLNKPYSELQ